jgi:hypothetical protein
MVVGGRGIGRAVAGRLWFDAGQQNERSLMDRQGSELAAEHYLSELFLELEICSLGYTGHIALQRADLCYLFHFCLLILSLYTRQGLRK